MAYTTHGHHISGSVLDDNDRPDRVARCGGPGMCAVCSSEAALWRHSNRVVVTKRVFTCPRCHLIMEDSIEVWRQHTTPDGECDIRMSGAIIDYASVWSDIQQILPGATSSADLNGRLIIYTDLQFVDGEPGKLKRYGS